MIHLILTATLAAAPPTDAELALRWAPIHYQDVDVTGDDSLQGRSDFIAAIDFDGDWNMTNNWGNAANHTLRGTAYYSVVETSTHWFIVYAFFHPRDWSDTPLVGVVDTHENDMEGLLAVVRRPSGKADDQFGSLHAIVTVNHRDFYSYALEGAPLARGIPGRFVLREDVQGVQRPVTAQEAKGHGLKAWPDHDIEGGDGVVYFPSLQPGEEPDGPNDREVRYQLVDIFAPSGLWSRRKHSKTFARYGVFRGRHGQDDKAHAPWRWDDHDDGDRLTGGELAVDPLKLVGRYFQPGADFGRVYLRNPYLFSARVGVEAKPLEWLPPWIDNGGDRDFKGHGPRTRLTTEIRVSDDLRSLEGRLIMHSEEWQDGARRRDYTTAAGKSPWKTIYQAPADRRIQSVAEPLRQRFEYVDDDHAMDEFLRGDGLMQRLHLVGDTDGDDAGIRTHATVWLHPLPVKLAPANPK